jgi:MFS family permease
MSAALIHQRRWKILRVLALSLVIIGLDNTILNVALPSLQEHFDASGSTLQWMVDSYLVSFAGLLLTLGMLGDRFGRKRALQTGIALFGLSSLAVLFVETSTQLIAVRALMGVGGALIMPATLSIITNVFPREERAKAIGVWAGTAAIGVGLGPLFGGLLLEFFDWSSVFLINVPVALVAFVAGMRVVPTRATPTRGASTSPARCSRSAPWWRSSTRSSRRPRRAGWTRPSSARSAGRWRSGSRSWPGSCAPRRRCST